MTPLVKVLGWNLPLTNWTARRLFPESAILFFASPQYITKPYLPADYKEDVGTQPVVGVVHIQAGWEGKDPVDETIWLEGLKGNNIIQAIVGQVNLSEGPIKVESVLQAHMKASLKVCGIRDMIAWHDNCMVYNFCQKQHYSRTPEFRESFALLQKYNLTFETFCYSTQLDEIVELAEAFPQQKILVDHVGTPVGACGQFAEVGKNQVEREQILQDWKQSMMKLEQCPNVYIKLSGLGMPVVGFGWANDAKKDPPTIDTLVEQLSPLIQYCVQVFTARRCMFGSNFPVDKVSVPSLDTYIAAYKRILSNLPLADQELIFRGTATEFYRLDQDTTTEIKVDMYR